VRVQSERRSEFQQVGAAAHSASRRDGACVVIVEDDAPLRAALVFDLEAEGYSVASFASSEEVLAVDVAAACLVVDLALPGMDGLTLIERLEARGVSAPAIIITTDPDWRSRARAAALGAEIVEKPLIGRRLQQRIGELVRQWGR
jgi:two-component system, LuxR family, response regulator FixJ